MRKSLVFACIFASTLVLSSGSESPVNPERLKRAESFLGIHFDFHAGEDCTEIGKDVTPEMVDAIIDQVHPDYIQVDSKGHAGFSSYPTQVGNPAPGFVRDQLKIWREVTARRGVALYVHHSGVWDSRAVAQHPEWARIREDGQPDDRITSVYGPYADRLLIPQLEEMRRDYGIDGVWVDGECWATERDYRPEILERLRREGFAEAPLKPSDPGWQRFSDLCRDGFRAYLAHYVDALHRLDPDFQIASNWAYSSMMPEPVTTAVDFISGDFSATDSVNSARFEGRCMVHQDKPWDLMAWSFTWTDGLYSTKSIPQLQQEAAIVIGLGGGFQGYFPQRRDGSVRLWQMKLMGEVARFCRDRQAVSHRAVPVPQIGLVYSGKAFYRENQKLFAAWKGELTPLKGILQSLLDSQNVVDVVMEHHLQGRMQDYPLLIYPEWSYVDPDFKQDLLNYVKEGGNLLVIGPKAAANFESELGLTSLGPPEQQVQGLAYGNWIAGINSMSSEARLGSDCREFGRVYTDQKNVNDFSGPSQPAASIRKLGKGQIAAAYLNLGERYAGGANAVARDFLNGLVRELFPDPMVEVSGSHHVDVTLNRKAGALNVHLVNTAGPHSDPTVQVFDEIPPVGPLTVRIRHQKPSSVRLEPGGDRLPYRESQGRIEVRVPRLDIHQVVVVE